MLRSLIDLFARYAALVVFAMLAALAGCAATKDARRSPAPLVEFQPALDVHEVWKTSVGKAGRFLFAPAAVGDAVYAAGANGSVAKIDAKTGQDIWRVKLDTNLSAGVGSDGELTAVGAAKGGIRVLGPDGQPLWKASVPGEIVSPPLVGNGLVVARTSDGQISAFDARTGELKWVYRNRAAPLNLRVLTGMTFAGGAAALAGFPGGVLAAINLHTGDAYWETPVSYPKGVTEVERINDVTGAPALAGSTVCVATFQGRIGCFDVNSGHPLWETPFSSASGLAQDGKVVVAADDWSVVDAFSITNGQRLWRNDKLKSRDAGAPFLLAHTAIFGDYRGFVHFLALADGAFVARMQTDGSAIVAAPVAAGGTLVVQTRDGGLYGFRPGR